MRAQIRSACCAPKSDDQLLVVGTLAARRADVNVMAEHPFPALVPGRVARQQCQNGNGCIDCLSQCTLKAEGPETGKRLSLFEDVCNACTKGHSLSSTRVVLYRNRESYPYVPSHAGRPMPSHISAFNITVPSLPAPSFPKNRTPNVSFAAYNLVEMAVLPLTKTSITELSRQAWICRGSICSCPAMPSLVMKSVCGAVSDLLLMSLSDSAALRPGRAGRSIVNVSFAGEKVRVVECEKSAVWPICKPTF